MSGNADTEKGLTQEVHINTWKQAIIISGGIIIMLMYRHFWRHLDRPYITDFENIIVMFLGSALLIYMSETSFNSKIVTAKIF